MGKTGVAPVSVGKDSCAQIGTRSGVTLTYSKRGKVGKERSDGRAKSRTDIAAHGDPTADGTRCPE
ncbi:hypothetical protein GV827_08335 [Sulfitobacter sp. JBTF-M27]|uniref:Uncharacterized protein n=1 Tax=Sulfitobacter sediminilitoris TaxID=2698830 RepID=A0A6P0CB86_9RHOB|nr:hypothetical protein [Sulfitobacter sediminilitoris]NEK22406.1 hypothetical protein [Sulfitobacter sediminilitoris]